MTAAQRIIVVIYCLAVVYCCVWIPWHVVIEGRGDLGIGYAWLWSAPPSAAFRGTPDLAVMVLRLVAATALCTAAFLLAGRWKALLSAAILAGLGFAGILLYGYWTDRVAQRRTQKIHDCAVAKVATAKCNPSNTRGDIFDQVTPDFCDRYGLSDHPTAQEEDAAIAAAEKECTAEIEPKQKSAHEQIEEYKRQHGIKE